MTSADVAIPKLNSNDDSYILIEWLVDEGQAVTEGEPIVVLETSKAAEEIASPCAGVVHKIAAQDSQCRPGEVIATIAGSGAVPDGPGDPAMASHRQVIVTEPARALAERYGIDARALAALGKPIIRVADVEQMRRPTEDVAREDPAAVSADQDNAAPGWSSYRLPRNQQHVAARVTQSHQLTPAAFSVIKVQIDPLMQRAHELAAQFAIFIGLPELVLHITASLRRSHPMIFARPCQNNPLERLELAENADIGVTVDVGTGLYIPVIKKADTASPSEIAQAFMRARRGAMRGGLDAQDRGEPTLVFAVSTNDDVVLTVPLIYPGTVATLMLAGVQKEVWIGADNTPQTRSFVNIGLAYDHRYINGRDAIAFLQAVKQSAEAPRVFEADDTL